MYTDVMNVVGKLPTASQFRPFKPFYLSRQILKVNGAKTAK